MSETRLAAVERKLDRLTALVERLAAERKQDAKWRMIFRRQLAALVRRAYLDEETLPHPLALQVRRFRLRSQNEEDGIVLALLRAAGVRHHRFIDIGSGGTGGNCAVLGYELGWGGLMIDSSRKAVAAARRVFASNPRVTVVKALLRSDSIDAFLEEHGGTGEVDVLSIDIDSFDYWLWRALTVATPRLVVIEYNAHFGPERAVTAPDGPRPEGAPKGYGGASLAALEKLGHEKGYGLVLCEDAGVNAFFLRDDVAPEVPRLAAAEAWRPQLSRHDAGGDAVRGVDLYAAVSAAGLPLVDV